MPTIYRTGNLKICIFSNDHNPPHFHVLTPNQRASMTIENMDILAGELSASIMKEVKRWHRENKDQLMKKWNEVN